MRCRRAADQKTKDTQYTSPIHNTGDTCIWSDRSYWRQTWAEQQNTDKNCCCPKFKLQYEDHSGIHWLISSPESVNKYTGSSAFPYKQSTGQPHRGEVPVSPSTFHSRNGIPAVNYFYDKNSATGSVMTFPNWQRLHLVVHSTYTHQVGDYRKM